MKLEPEYLTPYLPYSLKVMMEGKKTNVAWMSTKNIAVIIPDGIGEYKKIPWARAHHNIKPILRPLSDLTPKRKNLATPNTEIMERLKQDNPTFSTDMVIYLISQKGLLYKDFELLFKNHYDVFGLIEKGLAHKK